MWDHIREQPQSIVRATGRNRIAITSFARRLARAESITLSGAGSSLHAAMLTEYWLRAEAGIATARAIDSFELRHYFPRPAPQSALIGFSHRGSREALARGRGASILSAIVCGEDPRPSRDPAEYVFRTTPIEKSGTHTKSLTAALAIGYQFAAQTAQARGLDAHASAIHKALAEIPARLRRRIEHPAAERETASALRDFDRIILVGTGPAYVCAREGALKLKEAVFAHAEALETEEFLHGPIASVDKATLLILVFCGGPVLRRLTQASRAAKEIGAATLALINGEAPALARNADRVIETERCDESSSPFSTILSLQLFTYFSALARGTNPDRNRREDARYSRAAKIFETNFEKKF